MASVWPPGTGVPLWKVVRDTSRAGRYGSEMLARRPHARARPRMMMPGMQKLRGIVDDGGGGRERGREWTKGKPRASGH